MSLTRAPLTTADCRRAGALLLAHLDGDDRYEDLLSHTLMEYHPAAVIDALVAMWAGSIRWFEEAAEMTGCREAVQSYIDQPLDDADETTWDVA